MQWFNRIFLCCLWLIPTWAGAQVEPTDLAITADNSIVDTGSERDVNMGAATSIRLKSCQHHLILAFDTTPLMGRSIVSARLRYAQKDHDFPRVPIRGPWRPPRRWGWWR